MYLCNRKRNKNGRANRDKQAQKTMSKLIITDALGNIVNTDEYATKEEALTKTYEYIDDDLDNGCYENFNYYVDGELIE